MIERLNSFKATMIDLLVIFSPISIEAKKLQGFTMTEQTGTCFAYICFGIQWLHMYIRVFRSQTKMAASMTECEAAKFCYANLET